MTPGTRVLLDGEPWPWVVLWPAGDGRVQVASTVDPARIVCALPEQMRRAW